MTDHPDDHHDAPHAGDAAEPWRDATPGFEPASDAAADRAPATLWPVVLQMLDEREWTHDATGESTLVRVRGAATNYDVVLSTLEELAVVRCSIGLHAYVADPWRAATCDLINRINHDELLVGAFEMDPESGRLRWRNACDVEGGVLSATMVHNLVNAGMWACDRFWPALLAVSVLGTSPEAALEISREG